MARTSTPPTPSEQRAGETERARTAALLREATLSLRELSQTARIAEKELPRHLEHLARSASNRSERLRIEPGKCLACGFAFEDRTRFTRPGKCPACRSTRIAPARFALEPR